MKRPPGSRKRKREQKSTHWPTGVAESQEALRNTGSRRSRLLLIGAIGCVIFAAALVTRPLWRTEDSLETGAGAETKSSDPLAGPLAGRSTKPTGSPTFTPPFEVKALKQEANELTGWLLEESPAGADELFLMGDMHALRGNTEQALKYWKRSLKQDPNRSAIYDSMGLLAWNKGNLEEAVALWRKTLELNPNAPGVGAYLGRALIDLDRPRQAVAVLEQDVRRRPTAVDSYFYLAQAYLRLNEYRQAKRNHEIVIRLRPEYTRAYWGLSAVCAKLGQPEKAGEYREKFRDLRAAELEADRAGRGSQADLVAMLRYVARSHTIAGAVHCGRRNWWEAERHWRRAAILDPRNTQCRAALMVLYQRRNRPADALAFCKRLTQLQPKNTVNYLFLGNAYARRRRYDDAEQAYQEIVQLAPDQPEGYRALARLYLATGRKLAEAKALASKVVELKPNPQDYFQLANVCARLRDRASALAAVERALEMDPANPQCRQLRGSLRNQR